MTIVGLTKATKWNKMKDLQKKRKIARKNENLVLMLKTHDHRHNELLMYTNSMHQHIEPTQTIEVDSY